MKYNLRKFSFVLILIFIAASAVKAFAKDNGDKAIIKFEECNYKFQNVSDKQKMLTHDFEFTNTGNANLIIYDVISSCGCVKGEFPKNPIAPGKKGKIKVIYLNSEKGYFSKKVTVKSNAKPRKIVLEVEGYNK